MPTCWSSPIPSSPKSLASVSPPSRNSDLGAGFKIAALDLELRGAGNLLGGEQHGQINSVGFDTYVRLLDETVRELKGEEVVPEIRSALNLSLDIRIPPEYLSLIH